MSYIKLDNIKKQYGSGDTAVHAVKGLNCDIEQGTFVSIMGESGSGKSTLLSLLGAMNTPTSGKVYVDDMDIYSLTADQKADYRREYIGFVFQSFYLVPYLTVLENVLLPLVTVNDLSSQQKNSMALDVLNKVGLTGKHNRLPDQISGGERERTAVARAIVNKPTILMADEPTGNLDSKTTGEVMKLLRKLNQEGMTIIMVTHSSFCSEFADRRIVLSDGSVIDDQTIVKIDSVSAV